MSQKSGCGECGAEWKTDALLEGDCVYRENRGEKYRCPECHCWSFRVDIEAEVEK